MEILHLYYYRKGNMVAKATLYTILSFLFVGVGVFSFVHWELSILFSEWIMWAFAAIYVLVTLGTIISTVQIYRKISMANNQVPAFAVAADRFVIYDKHGLANSILFDNCETVRFKRSIKYRGAPVTLTMIVKYHGHTEDDGTTSLEFDFSELDCPQKEIDKQLSKIYKNYKKSHQSATRAE